MIRSITVLAVALVLSVGGALGLAQQDQDPASSPAARVQGAVSGLQGGDL